MAQAVAHEDELGTEEDPTPAIRAKWMIDGAATLAEAAQKARDFAGWLDGLAAEGWVLTEPVADDYGFIEKRGPDGV
jgi:hypothetical protein